MTARKKLLENINDAAIFFFFFFITISCFLGEIYFNARRRPFRHEIFRFQPRHTSHCNNSVVSARRLLRILIQSRL